jgi:hypothetical protein
MKAWYFLSIFLYLDCKSSCILLTNITYNICITIDYSSYPFGCNIMTLFSFQIITWCLKTIQKKFNVVNAIHISNKFFVLNYLFNFFFVMFLTIHICFVIRFTSIIKENKCVHKKKKHFSNLHIISICANVDKIAFMTYKRRRQNSSLRCYCLLIRCRHLFSCRNEENAYVWILYFILFGKYHTTYAFLVNVKLH